MVQLQKARRFVHRLQNFVVSRSERLASGRPWATRIFYGALSSEFVREQTATLSGKQKYWAARSSLEGHSPTLRRNIHMLEKGIVMRPRRDVFALGYIGETVDAYSRLLSRQESRDNRELFWAHEVLKSFFSIVKPHETIQNAQRKFEALPSPVSGGSLRQVPYARDLSAEMPVTYDALLALSQRRRSVRWFQQKSVPEDLVKKAMDVAVQAPSACNRQPFQFRFFDEPDMVKKIAAVPLGTVGYGENLPAIAVIVGQQRNFFDERDRHLIYIDGALAAMSFCFALETLGLASCLINWPDIEERERMMADLIGLEADERPVMLIGFGYPDPEGMVPASVKKSLDHIAVFN